MTHVLHLDSSAGGAHSFSRRLGRELVDGWVARDPSLLLTYRDLDADPLPFVDGTWIGAAFSVPEQVDEAGRAALAKSEELIAELLSADVLVIGAPMYNFGIPAALKAWVDQVVRVGRTFGYDGPTPVGLVPPGKRAIVLATSGGDATYYASLGLDFRSTYLQAVLGFIGITDVEVLTLTGTMADPDLTGIRTEIAALLDRQVSAVPV